MRRWLLPIVMLSSVLAVVLMLAKSESPESAGMRGGASRATQLQSPELPASTDGPVPAEPAPEALTPTGPPEVTAPPGWRGTVMDAAGRPLVGARVSRLPVPLSRSWSSHGPSPEDPTLLQRALACDTQASGEFMLPWEEPPEKVKWMLLVRHPLALSRLLECAGALERGGDCGTLQLAPGCMARGRVLAADGSPAVGADVDGRIIPYTVQEFDGDVQPIVGLREGLLHATTDDEGRFELGGLPAASLRLDLQHVGHAPECAESFTLSPGAVCEIGDLRLQRGGIVSGRVLDTAGLPVAGAEVRGLEPDIGNLKLFDHGVHLVLDDARTGGWDRSGRAEARACLATSDAQGRFEVGGLTQTLCGIVAAADGFEPVAVDAVPVGSGDVVLRLERVGSLRLRLVDAVDRGLLEDAELQVQRVWDHDAKAWEGSEPLVVERAVPGEFLVRGVCDAPLVASVRSPAVGLVGLRVDGLEPGAPDETRELAVPRAVSMTGRAIDSAGVPLGSARIHFAPYSGDQQPLSFTWNEVGVAPDGSFRLGPLPADDWVVYAGAEGRASARARRELAPGETSDLGDLVLPRMACVEARLLGAHGEPLRGVDVHLVHADLPPGSSTVLESGPTDSDGRVRLMVEPVAMRIQCRKPPLAMDLGTLAEAEIRSVVLQERAPVRVSGTVRSAGEPVASARIHFTHPFGTVSTTTDESGGFALDATAGLAGRLSARSPRGGVASRLVDLAAGSAQIVDLDFGALRLRGRVVQESTGAPLPGAKVQAWTEVPKLVGATVSVADDGSFELADMEDGAWVVQAFGEALSFSEQVKVELPAGAATDLLLRVEVLGSVSGRVLTAGGAPVSLRQATLYLLPVGQGDPESEMLDDDGSFEFERVTPGDFELLVTGGLGMHQRPWRQRDPVDRLAWLRVPVRVAPGQAVRQDVVLPPGRP